MQTGEEYAIVIMNTCSSLRGAGVKICEEVGQIRNLAQFSKKAQLTAESLMLSFNDWQD